MLTSVIDICILSISPSGEESSLSFANPSGEDIYNALRNIVLVRLLLNKIIDNNKLKQALNDELGKNLINKLKNNQESKVQREIALMLLRELEEKTRNELGRPSWEKIEL